MIRIQLIRLIILGFKKSSSLKQKSAFLTVAYPQESQNSGIPIWKKITLIFSGVQNSSIIGNESSKS